MAEDKKNLWSGDVKTHWHPEEGFFEQSPEKIAEGLKAASNGLSQAIDRLDFYINRAGSNLSGEAKLKLEKVKDLLGGLYN